MRHRPVLFAILLMLLTAPFAQAESQPEPAPDAPKPAPEKAPEKEKSDSKDKPPMSIAELAAKCDRTDGLFTLLRDKKTGELYLLVKKEQLGKEFIYFSYLENGIARFRLFRGNFRGSSIFKIERDFNRLRFVAQPTRWWFDPDNALSRAADANVTPAVIAAEKIAALDEDKGEYAIKADSLFLTEALEQIKPSSSGSSNSKSFSLGKLNAEKTRYVSVRSYPLNTDIIAELVYDDPSPSARPERDDGVTDSRYISIMIQHSLIQVPDNDYRPRRDDARVGYFMTQRDDMTSASATPYRDMIHRWHLKKKDPAAKLSEPVEPITWWIENTTPAELRDIVRDGVLAWNEAFEQAGFKNAIVVKVQPDDADWDAGDLRYNVLRWTSSPNPPFGGYGPSFVNPRTGQILGSDIMLEWVYVTNRVKYSKLFGPPDAGAIDDHRTGCMCAFGHELHASNLAGRFILAANGATPYEQERIVKQSVHKLALHELGHTLGLMHNMKASQLHAPKDLHNTELTQRVGLVSSVMDYPAVNLALPGEKQGDYYTIKPGPYDKWAIEYGYSEGLDDPAAEEKRLSAILSRSTQPELMFGNDADDMRYAGRGIDPRVMINDMSGDALTWAEGRLKLVRATLPKLAERFADEGESYQAMRNAYVTLTYQQSVAAGVISRYIGGVYVDRAVVGQPGATQPYKPVSREDQKRAMSLLAKHLFAPDAFHVSPKLLAMLQQQRRGFNHSGDNEDFRLHAHIASIQNRTLDHLLHKDTLARISDTTLYGNTYPIDAFLTDLTDCIIDDRITRPMPTTRQTLQAEYVRRLPQIAGGATGSSSYDHPAQAMAQFELRRIRDRMLAMDNNFRPDPLTRAHVMSVKLAVERALAAK